MSAWCVAEGFLGAALVRDCVLAVWAWGWSGFGGAALIRDFVKIRFVKVWGRSGLWRDSSGHGFCEYPFNARLQVDPCKLVPALPGFRAALFKDIVREQVAIAVVLFLRFPFFLSSQVHGS